MWHGGLEIRATRQNSSGVVSQQGRIVFTSGAKGASGAFDSPHWSRDGRRMVFHRADDPRPIGVQDWLSTDSRFGLVRVGLSFPSYSPDGARVTGSENSLPAKRVFVMNAEGSRAQGALRAAKPRALWSEHLPDHQSPRLVTAGRSHRLLRWRPHGCAWPDAPGADSPRRQRLEDAHERRAPRWSPELVAGWDASRLPDRDGQRTGLASSTSSAAGSRLCQQAPTTTPFPPGLHAAI